MAKILIVDDDPDIRMAIGSVLRSRGYGVVEASDGEEALARLRGEKPDLMLLDLMLPKKDGFAVVKELSDSQEDCSDIPILVVSSIREEASHRRYELEVGHKLNVEEYIEKPIEPFVLLERVARC
ncbi:MAG: response regulator, partial [Dehalococcoidia bacterium]|nr:response regulator [Dehalococcoidia bacterium]